MKSILTILLVAFCFAANAQYRYTKYTVGATNIVVAPSMTTNYNSTVDVGAMNRVQIQMAFSMLSTNYAACTNGIVALWQTSIDGTRFTNNFTTTITARTNDTVWAVFTNDVSNTAWLRLVNVTNLNNGWITNGSIIVGGKTGM